MYKPLFLTKDKNQDYEVMEGILAYCIPLIREPRWIDKTLRLAIRVFGQMVIDKIDLNRKRFPYSSNQIKQAKSNKL
uniref:Transposase n=1 Tax=Schistosoma mansoni TaxID=6183 RepID=A0A5K4FEB6_SCHMA